MSFDGRLCKPECYHSVMSPGHLGKCRRRQTEVDVADWGRSDSHKKLDWNPTHKRYRRLLLSKINVQHSSFYYSPPPLTPPSTSLHFVFTLYLPSSPLPSIVYIISAPASPVLGFMVDKIGKNVSWVICAVVATLAAHMMLAFTFWNPWIAMVMLASWCASVIWNLTWRRAFKFVNHRIASQKVIQATWRWIWSKLLTLDA